MRNNSKKIDETKIFKEIMTQFVVDEDPLLSMMKWMMEQLMKIESEMKVGAKKGEHNSERKSYFSGYRPRRFDTRLGTVYLMVPKIRKGGYIPFFITERKRSEQALIAMVQEAYVNGVSTRKIERLAKELGIENISASQVSQINKGLDEQVKEFRNRPLQKEYPFVWVDALYEKVRNYEGRVVSTAIMIAYGVTLEGKREVLAIEPFINESYETWRNFFERLKERGLQKIALLISDVHLGIQKAFKESFIGASWQRCKVHFMRNILAHVPPKAKEKFAAKLKQIWLQNSKKEAYLIAQAIIDEYGKKFPEAIEVLQEGLEDSLQFYHFPQIDKRRISSTNVLERINKEIRRRSKVVSVFPSRESYIRLITTYLMEYTEDWEIERSYIHPQKLQEVMEIYEAQLKAA
ncbi:IS256 family transposase [Nitrosophilus labii]|uniref:IS256 family transposase n=1 Tax=Nitrosophilus labii TaxID=2706014 RepID=UPI001656C4C1|nr:IS256 family transposase [Nitrosophilus labii]